MKAVQGLFGGGQAAAVAATKDAADATRAATVSSEQAQAEIRASQNRQQVKLDEENARVTAQQSALRRLFSGGGGRSLSDTALGTTLGG